MSTEVIPEKALFYAAFAASALFAGGGWLWAWFALRGVHTPLILHFSDYTGINQIGGMPEIHGLGVTGALMIGLNFVLARAVRAHDRHAAGLLAGATLLAAVLLFTALAAIISVNQ